MRLYGTIHKNRFSDPGWWWWCLVVVVYVVVVKDAPTEEEEEEEDKGRDEREPPQRSTTKTAHVDTTPYDECRLYLFILTQHFFKKVSFVSPFCTKTTLLRKKALERCCTQKTPGSLLFDV